MAEQKFDMKVMLVGLKTFLCPVAFQLVSIKLTLAARWRYIFQLLLTGNWLPQSCLSEIRWPLWLLFSSQKGVFSLRVSERWNPGKKRDVGADEAFHWLLYWDEMLNWNTWCLADSSMDLSLKMINCQIENIDSTTITDKNSLFHSRNKTYFLKSFEFGKVTKWTHILHIHWRWVR